MFILFLDFPYGLAVFAIIIIGIQVYRHMRNREQKSEIDAYNDRVRKDELQRILETREERTEFENFPEAKFWSLIDEATQRAKKGYSFQLGILRDIFSRLTPNELIQLDNLYHSLVADNFSHDISAASAIIFKSTAPDAIEVLINIFILRGEIFFRNACHNPDLIIGKEVNSLNGVTISSIIGDLYFRKAGNLIPMYAGKMNPDEISGETWEERDLPTRYRQLWEAFA